MDLRLLMPHEKFFHSEATVTEAKPEYSLGQLTPPARYSPVRYVKFIVSSIGFHPSCHSLHCQNSAMEDCVDHVRESSTVVLLASGCSYAENDTGYRERMPSSSSVINSRNLSLPWRYRWQKKMFVMCISYFWLPYSSSIYVL